MRVNIEFCIDSDVIYCPDSCHGKLDDYKNDFLIWLNDENIEHSYWVYVDGKKGGLNYRSEAFVEWLNLEVFGDSVDKARVIETKVKKVSLEEESIFL